MTVYFRRSAECFFSRFAFLEYVGKYVRKFDAAGDFSLTNTTNAVVKLEIPRNSNVSSDYKGFCFNNTGQLPKTNINTTNITSSVSEKTPTFMYVPKNI